MASAVFPSLRRRRSQQHGLFTDYALAKLEHVKASTMPDVHSPSSLPSSSLVRFFHSPSFSKAAVLTTLGVAAHALSEGLLVGQVAAPRLETLGMRMLLPSTIHSIPRGLAVSAAVLGALGGANASAGASLWALLAAAIVASSGMIGVSSAFVLGAVKGEDKSFTLLVMCSCGFMFMVASRLLMPKAYGIGKRRATVGFACGALVAMACLYGRYAICTNTSFCSLAPEAFK